MKYFKYLFLFIFALFLFKPFDSYAIDYGQIGVQFADESGNVIDELTSTLDRTINVKNVKYILMYTSTNTIKGNSYNLYYDWAIGYSNLDYPIALNVSNMLEEKQEIQHDSRIFVVENYQSSSSEYYVRFHMNSDFTSTATNAWNQVTITLAEPMDLTFYSVYNKQLKKTGGDNSEDFTSNTDKVIENQNQNTDKVIENQDQNTQDIINNNNENTDKIIDSNNKTQDVIKDQFNTCTDGYNLFDSEDWYNTYHNAPYCANCMKKEVVDDVEYYSFKTGCYGMDNIEYMTGQFKENTQYTLSFISRVYPGFSTGDMVRITYTDGRKTFILINTLNESFHKFTNPINTTIKSIGLTYVNNAHSLIRNIELDEGTTAKPYQKYGEKICTNKLDEAEETRKGIWDTIKELPSKFFDMLIGLFIPDNFDFINSLKDSLEDKLGFIAEIPLAVLDFLFGLATTGWDEFNSITFPSIEMFGVNFWGEQEISLQPAIDIFKPYKYITDILCVILCVNTLKKWYDSFSSGGGN